MFDFPLNTHFKLYSTPKPCLLDQLSFKCRFAVTSAVFLPQTTLYSQEARFDHLKRAITKQKYVVWREATNCVTAAFSS